MKLIGIQAVNFGYHRSIVVCLKVVLFFIFWLCVKTLLAVLSLNQIVIKICLEFSIWFLSQLFQALVQRTLVEKILGQFTRIMVQIQMAEHHVNDCTGITMLAQDLRAARLEKLHFILVVGKQNIVIESKAILQQVRTNFLKSLAADLEHTCFWYKTQRIDEDSLLSGVVGMNDSPVSLVVLLLGCGKSRNQEPESGTISSHFQAIKVPRVDSGQYESETAGTTLILQNVFATGRPQQRVDFGELLHAVS